MNKDQILYEDKDIIVCHKLAGIATQTAKIGQRDMVSEVSNYLGEPIKLVHRLDQPVEGILVFAKNQKAAADLSRQITSNQMEKYYYAMIVVNQEADNSTHVDVKKIKIQDTAKSNAVNETTLINYLYKDTKSNTSSIVTKDKKSAKRAELRYTILSRITVKEFCRKYISKSLNDFENTYIALARIKLLTGRHHQIRVQMSNAGMSLLGDHKYADEKIRQVSDLLGQKNVALCAYKLMFNHPTTGKKMSFHKVPEGQIFQNFSL